MIRPIAEVVDSLSFPSYATEALKIVTMDGALDPLVLNAPQMKVHSVLARQRNAGYPMRIMVLKARREGVSTYVAARGFREINRLPMRYACVCSADAAATDKVFKMVTLFQQEISEDIRRETQYSSRKEIVYKAPHRSEFLCQTAGKDVLGRGGLVHYLHATEFAFWPRAKEQFGGAAQEVPADPETLVVLESTANGTGGAFYDMYVEAVDRWNARKDLDCFLPVFLSWFTFAKYRRHVPAGWSRSHEEIELAAKHKLDDAQLAWRRWAIENQCQGDIRLFRQEYPATWREAFQATGQPVFDQGIMRFQDEHLEVRLRSGQPVGPFKRGLFDPRSGTFQERTGGYGWLVLEECTGNRQYAIGGDTTEYKLSDAQDVRSHRDSDGVVVMDRSSKRIVAIWQGTVGQQVLGEQILGAGRHYNQAWVAIEVPQGVAALQVLVDAGYAHIFQQRRKEMQWTPEDTEDLGFRTTTVSRHYLINDLVTVMRANGIRVQFQHIYDEMRTFEYGKDGKPRHMAGKHDDLIIGLALVNQADLHCPRDTGIALPEMTGEDYGPEKPNKSIEDLARVGAVDDFDDDDDFDEQSFYHTV